MPAATRIAPVLLALTAPAAAYALAGHTIAEGAEPAVMSREQFTRFVTDEITRWREVARESNIKVD